jgi:hypothetical protein
MVKLKFETLVEAHSVTLGPALGFRVTGNFLRQLPENAVVGEYARHQWHVRDGHFSQYHCLELCRVHFTDAEGTPSPVFGPFSNLRVADGTMYADGHLFAKFIDESLLWHSFELENYWPTLIISSGAAP